jgi:hypothetical protein
MTLIGLLIWIIVVVIVGAAVLGVVRALLGTPLLAGLAPYGNLLEALIVLLIVLVALSLFYGGRIPRPWP